MALEVGGGVRPASRGAAGGTTRGVLLPRGAAWSHGDPAGLDRLARIQARPLSGADRAALVEEGLLRSRPVSGRPQSGRVYGHVASTTLLGDLRPLKATMSPVRAMQLDRLRLGTTTMSSSGTQ